MVDSRLDHLFKSSLPLEHEVAARADNCGYFCCGEFSYRRINEAGLPVECSVDVHVETDIQNGDYYINLHALVECKYASPTVEWVFSSAPRHEPMMYPGLSILPGLDGHLLKGIKDLADIDPKVYGTRGVSLSSTSANPTAIKHGLGQLRHALPSLMRSILASHAAYNDGEPSPIPVVALLLVTNAPLRVLKPGVGWREAEELRSLDDIANVHQHICVYQKAGPELTDLCAEVSRSVTAEHFSEWGDGMKAVLSSELISSVEPIPVVSLDRLEGYLTSLRSVLANSEIFKPDWRK